jgi:hypothetical protein
MGIDPKRLRLEWVSASEGVKFQKVITEFTEEIRALGPLHLKDVAFSVEELSGNGHATEKKLAGEEV